MTGHTGVPRTFPPVHVGQWDGTDTWDKPCMTGHTGVPRTVPPVPCGMRQAMYDGTHGSP